MSQKLSGSVCVITGASAGIGRACALALAREGASLVGRATEAPPRRVGGDGPLRGWSSRGGDRGCA